LRHALKLQQVAGLEIDKQERSARFSDQIAEGVEIAVAAKVGNRQYIARRTRESWTAAAMRDVRTVGRAVTGPRAARDKERIGPFDSGLRRFIQVIEEFDRIRPGGGFDSRGCYGASLPRRLTWPPVSATEEWA
jgi:hypothetical protein